MKQVDGGEIIIRIIAFETYVEISVEDNGVGIENDILQQILEKKPASESGVGLLNINLRLQRLFGKGIQVKSTARFGTSLSFTLPFIKGLNLIYYLCYYSS